jgi:hypothetical protein
VQFLVPRQSYLHSLVPQALQQLQHLLPPGDATPWFEHGRLPLKWCVAPSHPPPEDFEGCMQRWCVAPQLPVTTLCNRSRCNACRRGLPAGVLYDLVAAPSGELPWRLTIHFRAFPDRMLPTYSGEAGLRAAFFNSLKEAACICRGSAQRVMEMAAGAQAGPRSRFLRSLVQQQTRTHARCLDGAGRHTVGAGGPVAPRDGQQPAAVPPDPVLAAAGARGAARPPPRGAASPSHPER